MRFYANRSYVVLYMMGGLAVPYSHAGRITPYQDIAISLAGPFAGLFLAFLIIFIGITTGGELSIRWIGIIPIPKLIFASYQQTIISYYFLYVNIFWSMVNLLPIFPLDGGQVARSLFQKWQPINGLKISLWVSVITGTLIAIWGYVSLNSFFMLLLFASLAYQSYQAAKNPP